MAQRTKKKPRAVNRAKPPTAERARRPSKRIAAQTVNALANVGGERIDRSILFIRGQRVMLDSDLAELYGVSTKRFNEQIKRNADRFPEDFRFQLSAAERDEVVANCDHLQSLKFSAVLPWAFTEHGAIMAASMLNSQQAVAVSILVVRAFVRLRQILAAHKDLARRIEALERRFSDRSDEHEAHIRQIYELIDELMNPTAPARKTQIGFRPTEEAPRSLKRRHSLARGAKARRSAANAFA
jgi:hypothetical protein